jgi:hypothetical protein
LGGVPAVIARGDLSGLLPTAITVVVVTWVLSAALKAGRKAPAPAADGTLELRYPRWMFWVGIACALMGVTVGLGVILTGSEGTGGLLGGIAFIVFFGALGGVVAISGHRYRLRITAEGLEETGSFGRVTTLRWVEARSVTLRPVAGELEVEGEGRKVGVSLMLGGLQGYVDAIKARLPEPMWRKAVLDLEQYRRTRGG